MSAKPEPLPVRISGPLLDRIDLHLELSSINYQELAGRAGEESFSTVRERIETAEDNLH